MKKRGDDGIRTNGFTLIKCGHIHLFYQDMLKCGENKEYKHLLHITCTLNGAPFKIKPRISSIISLLIAYHLLTVITILKYPIHFISNASVQLLTFKKIGEGWGSKVSIFSSRECMFQALMHLHTP